MNRTESVGSITSAFRALATRSESSVSLGNTELHAEIFELEEKVAGLEGDNAKLMHDAARWNHVKNRMYRQMGYSSPIQMQLKVDEDMSKTAEKEESK